MNIVERKRRLTAEAMQNVHAATTPYENETDGMESEEADIFERKDKFEKLLAKFQATRKENGLILKGNDLRTNIWLKKMEKLARGDLGLDMAGYKDYVNNLKEFANVNTDLTILARDGMFVDSSADSKFFMDMRTTKQADEFKDATKGAERVEKHAYTVQMALSKLLRKSSGYLNRRDLAAIKDLIENMNVYLLHSISTLDKVNRL